MVGAFVSLERHASDNDEARDPLERVARQISIIAALHDHLEMASANTLIELGPYLDEVVRLIDSTLAADVSVQGSFENMAVGSREASIVATIVNELAAKASKHSFNWSSGTTILSGKRVVDAGYRLVCSDDAEQREAEAIDPNRRVGLGLKILKASVCQLGETMTATGVNEGYSTWLHFHLSAGCPMAAFRQQHFSPGRSGARHEARHARA